MKILYNGLLYSFQFTNILINYTGADWKLSYDLFYVTQFLMCETGNWSYSTTKARTYNLESWNGSMHYRTQLVER